jgi:hypothetical protein
MVLAILSKFAKHRSSYALMSAILKKWPKKIVISPFRGADYPATSKNQEPSRTPVEQQCGAHAWDESPLDATAAGVEYGTSKEYPGKKPIGTGKGSDVTIYFSPWIWPDQGGKQCSPAAAGADSDAVLLHELVHSFEDVSGTIDLNDRYPLGDAYIKTDRMTEFYAILVANLYCSETARPLRKDHQDFSELPDEIGTSELFYKQYSSGVDKFASTYPDLANTFGSFSEITFNPFTAR